LPRLISSLSSLGPSFGLNSCPSIRSNLILGGLFGDVTVPKTSNRFERNAQIFSQLKARYQLKIEQAAQPVTTL
jgi:hypothetical protein